MNGGLRKLTQLVQPRTLGHVAVAGKREDFIARMISTHLQWANEELAAVGRATRL